MKIKINPDGVWYHGSNKLFHELNKGSIITQWKELDEAFSHKPSSLGYDDNGNIEHNGVENGYLYMVDEKIFQRCMCSLAVKAEECMYVGDGGSEELETARKLGIKAIQAAWYLQEGTTQPAKRKHDFLQIEKPLEVLYYLDILI